MHASQEARSCATLDVQILMILVASEGQGRSKEFWGPRQQTFWGPFVHAGADLLSLLTRYPIDIWTLYSVVKMFEAEFRDNQNHKHCKSLSITPR